MADHSPVPNPSSKRSESPQGLTLTAEDLQSLEFASLAPAETFRTYTPDPDEISSALRKDYLPASTFDTFETLAESYDMGLRRNPVQFEKRLMQLHRILPNRTDSRSAERRARDNLFPDEICIQFFRQNFDLLRIATGDSRDPASQAVLSCLGLSGYRADTRPVDFQSLYSKEAAFKLLRPHREKLLSNVSDSINVSLLEYTTSLPYGYETDRMPQPVRLKRLDPALIASVFRLQDREWSATPRAEQVVQLTSLMRGIEEGKGEIDLFARAHIIPKLVPLLRLLRDNHLGNFQTETGRGDADYRALVERLDAVLKLPEGRFAHPNHNLARSIGTDIEREFCSRSYGIHRPELFSEPVLEQLRRLDYSLAIREGIKDVVAAELTEDQIFESIVSSAYAFARAARCGLLDQSVVRRIGMWLGDEFHAEDNVRYLLTRDVEKPGSLSQYPDIMGDHLYRLPTDKLIPSIPKSWLDQMRAGERAHLRHHQYSWGFATEIVVEQEIMGSLPAEEETLQGVEV